MKNIKEKFNFKNLLEMNFGNNKDVDYFVDNLSILVSSGMTIIDALNAIDADLKYGKSRVFIKDIIEDVNDGISLWRAVERANILPNHIIYLMRLGEETGRLSENLKLIKIQKEKSRDFGSKVRSAMMYPVFIMSVAFIIGVSIAWSILPRLAIVFSQLNIKLPIITKVLIDFGQFLNDYGIYVIPVVLFLIASFIYFLFYYKKTKIYGQKLLFFIPGISRLLKESEVAQFGYLLGTLIEAGLPIDKAIYFMSEVTTSPYYKDFYIHLLESIEQGDSFQQAFASHNKINSLFPRSVVQMISSGEKSGNLKSTFASINKSYELKVEDTTKSLSVMIEPILLVIVWLGVVSIAVAVVLPIYSLIGGFNSHQ